MKKQVGDDSDKPGKPEDQGQTDPELRYRRLFETIQQGILILDADTGEILDANPFLEKMLACGRNELLGNKLWDTGLFKDSGVRQDAFKDWQKSGYFRYDDLQLETRDGKPSYVEFIANAYSIGRQRVIQCDIRSINEIKQARILQDAGYQIGIAAETTRNLDDLYLRIHQIISLVMPAENFYITLYDETDNVLRFSYFKNTQDEPFLDKIDPGKGLTAYVLRTGKSLLCTQALHDELERRGEIALLGMPSAIWLGVPLTVEGKTLGVMVVQHYTDPDAYTEHDQHILEFVSSQIALAISRKQAEETLRRREQEFQSLVDNSPDAILRFDPGGRYQYVNPAMASLFGLPPAEIIGKNFSELPRLDEGDEEKIIEKQFLKIFSDPREHIIEFKASTPMGPRWLQSREVPEFGEDGSIESVLMVTRDITEHKQMEEQLRYLTNHDKLTGLYNRAFFEEELGRLDRGRGFPVSIIMADIDDLKEANDRFGHSAGDEMLQRFAQVLSTAFRKEDVAARIGGDEFAVLLPNTGTKAAREALCRVKRLLDEHNAAQNGIQLHLSFGVSTAETRASLMDVLKDADSKMYSEKQAHADCHKNPLPEWD